MGPYRAARDLLLRHPPRSDRRFSNSAGSGRTDPGSVAKRVGTQLDHSLLAIQGPPGAGKTYTGARMICELVRQGKRVGITATSHKVIRNLLDEVVKAAGEEKSDGPQMRSESKRHRQAGTRSATHSNNCRDAGDACRFPWRSTSTCRNRVALGAGGLFRGR